MPIHVYCRVIVLTEKLQNIIIFLGCYYIADSQKTLEVC